MCGEEGALDKKRKILVKDISKAQKRVIHNCHKRSTVSTFFTFELGSIFALKCNSWSSFVV